MYQQPDFACRAGSLTPTANTTAGYDHATCCDGTCVGNSDGSPDVPCAPANLIANASSTQAYDRTACCDLASACAGGAMADFGAGICVPCPFPSRCADGVTCGLNSRGRGCAVCKYRYFTVVSLDSYLPAASSKRILGRREAPARPAPSPTPCSSRSRSRNGRLRTT